MISTEILIPLQRFLVMLVPALLGIILHEVAHGWVANRLGDPTARLLGRLTLNPLPHIDPMGTFVFVLTALTSPFVFGWAKPVPVDARYFRQPARDMMLVALAGPGANFLLALLFTALLRVLLGIAPAGESSALQFFVSMAEAGVVINLGLGWLNLLPIPPLDGSKILAWFLPPQTAYSYLNLERYGFIILILLLMTNVIGKILGPLMHFSVQVLLLIFGL